MRTIDLDKYPIIVPKKKKTIPTPEHEYNLHALVVCAGKRGSGKTVAVSSKLRHLKSEGLADRVFLIAPTAISNTEMWKGLINEDDIYTEMDNSSVNSVLFSVQQEAEEWEEYLYAKKLYDMFQTYLKSKKSIDEIDHKFLADCVMYGILNVDTESIEEPKSKYGHQPVLHLVADDCQSSKLFNPSTTNKFLNACIRHRHLGLMKDKGDAIGLSIWCLIQNYSTQSGLPRAIRQNCTVLLLFPMADEKALDKVKGEMGGEVNGKVFDKVYHHACKDPNTPHSFLSIEFAPKKKEYTFRKDFNQFLVPEDMPEINKNLSHDKINTEAHEQTERNGRRDKKGLP